MSWWVYLEDRTKEHCCNYGIPLDQFVPEFEGDEPCSRPCYPSVEVPRFEEGGTLLVGGTTQAELNVTYNYGQIFWLVGLYTDKGGFSDWLTGKTGVEVIAPLEIAVERLGAKQYEDYWAATPGNAGYALNILLGWAKLHPEAVFRVS